MTPSETSSSRRGLHFIESLAKQCSWKPQPSLDIIKDICCSPQLDGKALLLRTTHMYDNENMEKLVWCLAGNFTPIDYYLGY